MEAKFLYHITHYKNLSSIFENGGLSAYLQISNQHLSYRNIAHNGIQERRATTSLPIYPFGFLHDYVPFYFAPRSPMLYAIKQGRVEGLKGNQDQIVYLVTRTDIIKDAGLLFVFTDGHAIMYFSDFYNDLSDINQVDWSIMKEKFWNDTVDDPDRKRRRQAEFLIHQFIGLEHFLGIAVRNKKMKENVDDILSKHSIELPVLIKPDYYF